MLFYQVGPKYAESVIRSNLLFGEDFKDSKTGGDYLNFKS